MGVVFLAVAWMGLRPRSTPYGNLLYNDVSMAEWFERYSHDPNDRVAEEALKHFGADLAPFLIEKIQSRDSEFQRFLAQARKKLQEQFPTIMDQLPRPMPASMIQARAEKAFRLVVHGRRPLPELRLDGVVAALVDALRCEDSRQIAGRYEKLDSGELAPLLVGREVRSFSMQVLGLLREQATEAVPSLKETARSDDVRLATSARIALERITGEPYQP